MNTASPWLCGVLIQVSIEKSPWPKLSAALLGTFTKSFTPSKLRAPATLPGMGAGPPTCRPLLPPTISAAMGTSGSSRGYQAVMLGGGGRQCVGVGVGVHVAVAGGVRVGVRVGDGVTVGLHLPALPAVHRLMT